MSSWQYMEIKGLIDNSKKLTFDVLKNTPEDVVSIGKLVVILIDDEEEKTFMIGMITYSNWCESVLWSSISKSNNVKARVRWSRF